MKLRLVGLATLALALGGCGSSADDSKSEPDPGGIAKEDAAQATQDGKADWPFDICERRGWYGDGTCDWYCPKRDPDCNPPVLGPAPNGNATQYPIVLAHGFDASPTNRWGFNGVAPALEADGHQVYVATVSPYNSVQVRAGQLAKQIDDALTDSGAAKVNLICHSMGGLDCRYVVASLDHADRVASVTTISSPHRGTKIADIGLKLIPGAADTALNAIAKAWGKTFSEMADDTSVRAALESLSEANSGGFNAENPDAPGVYYQSWAGVSSVLGIWNPKDTSACDGKTLINQGYADPMDVTLVATAGIVGGTSFTPNDGMATVASAKWGDFKGCVPADHLDEVGQVGDSGASPYTGFDHLRFYRNLAFDLSKRGF